MDVCAELKISKELGPTHELVLAILLTREYLAHIQEKKVFEPAGISLQQYNILRILRGGPEHGYMVKDLRSRVIYRFADMPRLVDRLEGQDLVERHTCHHDRRGSMVRITEKGLDLETKVRVSLDALMLEMGSTLNTEEQAQLMSYLDRLRDDYRERLEG